MFRHRSRAMRRTAAAASVMALAAIISPSVELASATSGETFSEQQGSLGVDTFRDPHTASGLGPRVQPGQWVEVTCKVYAPEIQSANPDGYWYLIASSPWNNEFYAPANTFMNGDPPNGPYTHFTDFAVPDCGSAPESEAPAEAAPAGIVSVFFTGAGDAGYDDAAAAGVDFILTDDGTRDAPDWSVGTDCSNAQADQLPEHIASSVTTLAGWSLGRLGPIYLISKRPDIAAHVNFVLLFDPGNLDQLSDCDARVGASQILANWLAMNPANQLVILAGEVTAEYGAASDRNNAHQSIQQVYFPAIRGTSFAQQVTVCNIENNGVPWSHEDVMRGYAHLIEQPPTCPSEYVAWHP